ASETQDGIMARTQRPPLAPGPILLAITALLTTIQPHSAPYQAPGTRRMAERLQTITEQSNPLNNLYMNRERAELFGKQLNEALAMPDSPDKGAKVLDLASKRATELLLAGQSWEAIQEFTRLDAFVKSSSVKFSNQSRSAIRLNLAIAYLRLG